MSSAAGRRVTLITPSYSRDLWRVLLLAESIERLDIDIPHVVIAHTEDLADFQRSLAPYRSEVVATADVLPPRYERRRANRFRKRDPRHWASGRPIPGWGAQQMVKLAAPMALGLDILVCVDSDVAFLRHVEASDFYDPHTAKALLYETVDENAETASWTIGAANLLGVPLRDVRLRQYIHHPVVMDGRTVQDLDRRLGETTGKSALDCVLRSRTTEYPLYGVYARYVDKLARVVPSEPLPVSTLWTTDIAPDGVLEWAKAVLSTRPLPFGIAIQSTIPSDRAALAELLRSAWSKAE